MMGHISKQILTIAALAILVLSTPQAMARESTVLVDPLSGVALEGYDPISYFTGAEPLAGSADFELVWQGVPWHFANAANREAFRRAPELYAPQFGGHNAMGLARGHVSRGNPMIHAVYKSRLYLFYSVGNREAFLKAPDAAALSAESHWREVAGR